MRWPTVTVAILTYNGETYLDAILSAIESQDYPASVDVLVIDSGSTDSTLDIVRAHPSVRLHEIPNSEFGHGRTRNLAVRLAESEIVVLLTHDAVPVGDSFLQRMVEPFETQTLKTEPLKTEPLEAQMVAAVLARQVARRNAPPALKYIIDRVFAAQGPAGTVTVHTASATPSAGSETAAFLSDVAVALRRSVVVDEVPYRDVAYAEDQLLGRDLLAAGYAKAYAPDAVVEHSNDGNLREFGERALADRRGLNSIGIPPTHTSWVAALARLVKWSAVDSGLILRDPGYTFGEKARWLMLNPVYHAVRVWNDHKGARDFVGDDDAKRGADGEV